MFAFILGIIVTAITVCVFRFLAPETDTKTEKIGPSELLSSQEYPFTWSRPSRNPARFVVIGIFDGYDAKNINGELNLTVRRSNIVTPKISNYDY